MTHSPPTTPAAAGDLERSASTSASPAAGPIVRGARIRTVRRRRSRDHPPGGAQGGDVHARPAGGQVDLRALVLAQPSPASPSPPTSSPTTRSPRRGRTPSPSPPTPACSAGSSFSLHHRVPRRCGSASAPLVAFDLFLIGFGFTLVHRARRVRVHPARRLAHAAGLADQQVRHHQLQAIAKEARHAAEARTGRRTHQGATTAQGYREAHGAPKPPTASKRYTPKAPPRKKIPSPPSNRSPPRLGAESTSASGACRPIRQRRAQQLQHVGPAAHQRAGRRLLPERPQHLHLGDHPDHRGVDGQQAAAAGRGGASCRRPSPPRGTTRPAATSGSRASVICVAAGGPSRPTSRRRPEQLRLPGGQPEHRAHDRLDPVPALPRPWQRRLEGRRQVAGAPGDHRLQQGVLRGEPVEDRLLGELEPLGHGVERRRLVAPAGEGGQGGIEDAVTGRWSWALTKW